MTDLAVDLELVALRVAAEIIIGVENQYARLRPLLTIEMRARESADAAADDDQIMVFGDRCAAEFERLAVAQPVRRFERSDVTAAQAAARRRVYVDRRRRRARIG